MSRTTVHAPHWVTATWYEPIHAFACEDNPTIRAWQRRYTGKDPCDLPTDPVRRNPIVSRRWGRRPAPGETRCVWEPDWTGVRSYPHPPRWFVAYHWHNPERTRLRAELARARAEYRGSGGTDVDPEPRQARGSADWVWS